MTKLLLSLIFVAEIASARVVTVGDEVETLTLAYGGPTILRFPSPVKTVSQASRFQVAPADETQPNFALLSVMPRFSRGEDRVSFLLNDGQVIQTKLVVVPKAVPEKTDSFYDLKRKDSFIEKSDKEQQTAAQISEIELMKAMIRSDQVAGYQVRKLIRTIDVKVDGIECQLMRLYTGPKFNGYVFKITNRKKDTDYSVDLTQITLGSPSAALLSQIDDDVISHAEKNKPGEIFLRIVAKPTSVYSQVNVPFAEIKKES